jgi:hypothetical protein
MPVDTSIYNQIGAGQQDPLDMVGKIAQTQNLLNQNAQFQQQFRARQALGPILQGAIDPQTGQLDYNKAFINMSGNPDTAWLAGDFLNQAVARQQTQADTAIKALELAGKKQQAYGQAAQGLLAGWNQPNSKDPTKVGPQAARQVDVVGQLSDLVAQGLIDKNTALEMAASLPPDGPQLYDHVMQIARRTATSAEAMRAVYGDVTQVPRGGITSLVQAPLIGGTPTVRGELAQVPTTEQYNAGVQSTTPSGATVVQPRFQAMPMVTGSGQTIPGTGQGPQATGQGPQAAGQGPSGGPLMTSLPPAQKSYLEGRGKDLADMEKGVDQAVSDSRTVMLQVEQVRDLMKKFQTGGLADVKAKLAQVGQGLGVSPQIIDALGLPGTNLYAAQAIMKTTLQQSAAVMRALVGNRVTNFEFEKGIEANPNIAMDPKAINEIYNFYTKVAKLADLQQQGLADWKSKHGADLSGFPAAWNRELDRRGVIKYIMEQDHDLAQSLTGAK